jgi:hypothetical protein
VTQTSETAEAAERAGASLRRSRLHSDIWVAAAILCVCAVLFAFTTTFDEIPATLAQGMQAAVFPQLVIGVLALLTIIMAWTSRSRPDPAREPITGIFYWTAGFILAFMGVLTIAGMMVATPFAIAGMGRLWGERRWWLLLLVGICLAVLLRVLFVNVFGVQLPNGLIVDRWR